jgi:hypothetical protein
MKMHFNNTIEKDSVPKQYTRKLVFEIVKNIEVVFGNATVEGQKRQTYLSRSNQFFSSTFCIGRTFKLVTALI